MPGRSIRVLATATMLSAVVMVDGAAAQSPPTLGGGRLPSTKPAKHYRPTVNISMQPRGDKIAMLFDTSVRCGRDGFDILGAGQVAWDGTHFSFAGTNRQSVAGGRLTSRWTVTGQLSGDTARGTLHIAGVRRRSGRLHKCARKPNRPFTVRAAGPRSGAPAKPAPNAFYAGTTNYELYDRMQAPLMLRVSKDARKVAAQWTIAERCGSGRRDEFVNFTPPMKVRPDGSFSRKEHFSVQYSDALIRYRPTFTGRFTADGASGTLRLRTRIYNRRGTKLITRCDSDVRVWNVAPGS